MNQLPWVDEGEPLDRVDPNAHYRQVILPAKLRIDAAYLQHRALRGDPGLLAPTARANLGRAVVAPLLLPRERDDA